MVKYPYQDPTLTIRERVTDLLGRMSLQEKVGQVNQHLYGWECYESEPSLALTDTFKEHVAWGGGLGALYGLFRADPWSKVDFHNGIKAEDSWKVANLVQEYVIQHSRWGIPALLVEECPHGHQGLSGISYPTNLGRGNSFNTELMTETSRLMARELAAKGVHLALVSTLDLMKDPRWGRSEECFGEDPILAARFSEAVVAGFQGEMISEKVSFLDQTVAEIKRKPGNIGVVLKHCIAQGEALGGHNSGTVTIGSREFSDVYFPLLKSTHNAAGVMAAYNDLDGVPCHINETLFEQLLREEYHYQGIVMADGIALDRLNDVFDSQLEAASAALSAGVDLSLWDETYTKIAEAVTAGLISEEVLDRAAGRVLSLKFMLGLFEQPFVADPNATFGNLLEESQAANLRIAEESITLLKNEGILPLAATTKQKIAVIGPNADELYNLLGDYTAPQSEAAQQATIFRELKQSFSQAEVVYAKGCEVRREIEQEPLLAEAEAVASQADVIVLVLGGSSARNFDMAFLRNGAVSSKGINMDSGENVDVASLALGGCQIELLQRIAQLNKPIISILVQGRPYELTEVVNYSTAVLTAWFPGQQGAQAIARLLTGAANPSGKLSISYPQSSGQLPVYYYQRAAAKQDDYYDLPGKPFYPFGFGLSYTEFSYHSLVASSAIDKVTVSVKVENKGDRIGKETVLLFVKLHGGRVIQRTKLLRAFRKIVLQPQEEQLVQFDLSEADFTYTDLDNQLKTAEAVTIFVGDQQLKVTRRG